MFTSYTDTVDEASAKQAVASVINENDSTSIKSDVPGIWRGKVKPGGEVSRGDVMATIFDPLKGEISNQILSPTGGIVFFSHSGPLVMENEVVFKIIRRLHS